MSFAGIEPTVDMAVIDSAARAVVYMTVDWSMPERRARAAFADAVPLLRAAGDICVFVIVEDHPATTEWLASHGCPTVPLGTGTVYWLERGRIVSELLQATGATAVVRHTIDLWLGPQPVAQ